MLKLLRITMALLLVMMLSMSVAYAASPGLDNFTQIKQYEFGHFTDIDENQWYVKNVKTAYELGLFVGSGSNFKPDGNISIAETLAVASRLHNTYYGKGADLTEGSPWYPYIQTGISVDIYQFMP